MQNRHPLMLIFQTYPPWIDAYKYAFCMNISIEDSPGLSPIRIPKIEYDFNVVFYDHAQGQPLYAYRVDTIYMTHRGLYVPTQHVWLNVGKITSMDITPYIDELFGGPFATENTAQGVYIPAEEVNRQRGKIDEISYKCLD